MNRKSGTKLEYILFVFMGRDINEKKVRLLLPKYSQLRESKADESTSSWSSNCEGRFQLKSGDYNFPTFRDYPFSITPQHSHHLVSRILDLVLADSPRLSWWALLFSIASSSIVIMNTGREFLILNWKKFF